MKADLLRVWLAEAKASLEKQEADLIAWMIADEHDNEADGWQDKLERLVLVQMGLESITTRIALLKD